MPRSSAPSASSAVKSNARQGEPRRNAEERRGCSANSNALTSSRLRAFTLVELLVALSVMLILATLTFRMVGSVLDSDRIKTGSRELQSFLAGARDRAIYAGQPRGVRFIADQTDLYTIRSFAYIGAPTNYTDSNLIDIQIGPPAGTIVFQNAGTLTNWQNLWNRGLLANGAQIQLRDATNTIVGGFLTVSPTSPASPPTGFAITSAAGLSPLPRLGLSYQLQLSPALLPGEEPRTLPDRIAIDLRTSILPASWTNFGTATEFDLLFSPDGRVYGPPASDGRIHFVLADTADTTGTVATANLNSHLQLNAPWQASYTGYVAGNVVVPIPSSNLCYRCTTGGTSGPGPVSWPTEPNQTVNDNGVIWQAFAKKSNLIVSLATATGRVTTHPVDMSTTLLPAGTGYDTFRFAELGEVTQ